jgi:hypothetical protein
MRTPPNVSLILLFLSLVPTAVIADGFAIISQAKATCAGVMPGGATGDRVRATTIRCHTAPGQRFVFRDTSDYAVNFWAGSQYADLQVIFSHSNKCLDVRGASTRAHAAVQQYRCHKGANQRWDLMPVDDTYYEVRNPRSNMCLTLRRNPPCEDFPGSFCFDDWDSLMIDHCRGLPEQRWNIARPQRLVAKHSRKCLDIEYSGIYAGNRVVQNSCQDKASQLWVRRPDLLWYRGPVMWANLHSGYCLDAWIKGAHDQWYCLDDEPSQFWQETSETWGHSSHSPESRPSECLDVRGRSKSDGVTVGSHMCHSGDNQLWSRSVE